MLAAWDHQRGVLSISACTPAFWLRRGLPMRRWRVCFEFRDKVNAMPLATCDEIMRDILSDLFEPRPWVPAAAAAISSCQCRAAPMRVVSFLCVEVSCVRGHAPSPAPRFLSRACDRAFITPIVRHRPAPASPQARHWPSCVSVFSSGFAAELSSVKQEVRERAARLAPPAVLTVLALGRRRSVARSCAGCSRAHQPVRCSAPALGAGTVAHIRMATGRGRGSFYTAVSPPAGADSCSA
jgi:hypothetical protein